MKFKQGKEERKAGKLSTQRSGPQLALTGHRGMAIKGPQFIAQSRRDYTKILQGRDPVCGYGGGQGEV